MKVRYAQYKYRDKVDFARELYFQGVSIKSIAMQVGCCKNTILNWCYDILKSHATKFEKGYTPYNKGKHHSSEELEKMRVAMLGEKNPFFGKKHTEESMAKMALSHTWRIGKDSANWKGGVAPINERIRKSKHKMQLIGLSGYFSKRAWQELKEKYGFMCLCCKRVEPEIKLTQDHIIPISKWKSYIQFHPDINYGCNDIQNIQPLCQSCNSKKNTKVINYISN